MASLYFVLILSGLVKYDIIENSPQSSPTKKVKTGSAIMCYECNSATNSLCLEAKIPDSLKRNCSEHDRGVKHTLCRKIVQHVEYGINGKLPENRVIRSCGWDETKYKGQCYHRAGYGGRQEVCSCLTDFCNGAQQTTATAALLTTAVMIAGKIICQ